METETVQLEPTNRYLIILNEFRFTKISSNVEHFLHLPNISLSSKITIKYLNKLPTLSNSIFLEMIENNYFPLGPEILHSVKINKSQNKCNQFFIIISRKEMNETGSVYV